MRTHDTSHRVIFGHAAMASLVLSLGLGCDPVDDGDHQEELLLQAEEAQLVAPEVDVVDEVEEPAAEEPATPAQRRSDPGFGLVAENDPVGYEWLGWFSEYTPPSTCPTNTLVTGTQCWGGWCNWMQLECHPGNGTHGSRSWTVYFSEENTNYQICPGSAYVSGMSCTGGYCDNISLECTTTNTNPAPHTCAWSGWFSEEDAPFYAPWATAVKGVQCSGDNCDALRYYYCPV
jgi:hypothetical protein